MASERALDKSWATALRISCWYFSIVLVSLGSLLAVHLLASELQPEPPRSSKSGACFRRQ